MANASHAVPVFENSGFFVFRTPLLPFSVLSGWSEGLLAASAAPGELDTAVKHDKTMLESRLRVLVDDAIVREALFVASPSLDEAIESWRKDPASPRAEGVVDILTRYLARMCSRSTPFGLFSGCSSGRIDRETRVEMSSRDSYARHTRLDTQYLSSLCDALERLPALRPKLTYRPSTGLSRAAGQLRNRVAHYEASSRSRRYTIVSVASTPYLESTLERAAHGATLSELVDGLVADDPEIARDEAQRYVGLLIDAQVLRSDLAPPITGLEPVHDIASTLRAANAMSEAEVLEGASAEIGKMDTDGLGLSQERYRRVASRLSDLPAGNELPRLFQVDLYKPADDATLGGAPLRELESALSVLMSFRSEVGPAERFRSFREAFVERYEGREVPLSEVLDDERGIGIDGRGRNGEASPLLKGLGLSSNRFTGSSTMSVVEQWLLRRVTAMTSEGSREWNLDEKDLAFLRDGAPKTPPDAFSAMAVLAARSKEALESGAFTLYLHGAGGPSGASLLGRFCHGDPRLGSLVKEHLRAEEALRPDAVFAEVVHLPEGRMGNILCRPVLRAYEIPFLGRSGAPEADQIQVSDLRVSVQGGRVVLRSERLGREVLPRLTTAHNYARGMSTYRFLCMLQAQDIDPSLGWSWGAVETMIPFLPRVTVGRTVLALAKWTLRREDLVALGQGDLAGRFKAVQELRSRLSLPRWVGVVDSDNVLTVDLENVVQVESLIALVKKRPFALLQEIFPKPDELCARGPEGAFTHELIVPFVRTQPRKATSLPRRVALARSFATGSEWLYAKLYTGTATADRVLRDVVGPLVAESLDDGDIHSWFFVRYGDPGWHLRVRLHGDPERLTSKVIPRLHRLAAPFVGDGRIWRLGFDTYEREVERYGGDRGMLVCEKLFHADSDAALRIQRLLSGDAAAEARWRLALRGMHQMLVDLGLDLRERHEILGGLRASFAAEHGVQGGNVERELGLKFRSHRSELEKIVFLPASDLSDATLREGCRALDLRSASVAAAGEELLRLAREDALTATLSSVAGSLLHMHANRLLRSQQRAQEFVLYEFLWRLYDSELARARKRGGSRAA